MASKERHLPPPPDMSHIPLANVIMCCTSIPPEQRSELSAIAAEMGATSKLDLTSDVTHLIVGEVDTPKYKYVAKERPDVKCLLPQWVYAVREAWMAGEELDVEAIEAQYKLPTFMKLRICVTGFEDLRVRKSLEDTINANGGEYRGDLTKDVSHLIAFAATGQKYKYAKQWGIKVVTLEWLQQSLERGMVLEESLYDPLMEEHERGKGAWIRRSSFTTTLGKRRREDENAIIPGRKLRRSASSKFDSQNDGFWTDIVSGPSPKVKLKLEKDKEPIKVDKGIETGHVSNAKNPFDSIEEKKPRGLFAGKRFYLHGFDEKKSSILEKHLSSHEADLVSHEDRLNQLSASDDTFVLVPHTISSAEMPQIPTHLKPHIVTDFWLEKCLHKRFLVDPSTEILCSTFQFPIEGFDQLTVSSTAFGGIDLLHLCKAVQLLGAKYDEFLTQQTSILICNDSSVTREKIQGALEWRIPAVKAEWLWDSIETGKRKDFTEYLLFPKAQQHVQGEIPQAKPKRKSPSTSSSRSQSRRETPAQQDPEKKQGEQTNSTDKPKEEESNGPFVQDDDSPLLPPTEENNEPLPSDLSSFSTKTTQPILRPEPLKERSPNSPNRSPTKSINDAKQLARETLSDTLASILAHEKTALTTRKHPSSDSALPRPSSARRERKLLGRATSNLSTRSGGALSAHGISMTRESSIDTMNTDGLGTPIEPVVGDAIGTRLRGGSFRSGLGSKNQTAETSSGLPPSLTTSALTTHEELLNAVDDDETYAPTQHLPLTQVGYEEAEAGRWRANLMRKITGMKSGNGNGDGEDDVDGEEGEEGKAKKGRRKDVLVDEGSALERRRRGRLARC